LSFGSPAAHSALSSCKGVSATITGTSRADRLTGTPARDVIVALGGNDVIDGGGGKDLICGGSGNDVIFGGPGNDTILGDPGNDFVAGEAGNDRLNGGSGFDTCSQNVGRLRITGCETIVRRSEILAPGKPLLTDAEAAALVRRRAWDPREENAVANHTVPTGAVPWSMTEGQLYWRQWIAKRNRVTGNFTGTTDEILQWGAYKWGIDEDLMRAVAVQESHWRQSTVGDNGASFGLMQVKDHYSNGSPVFGGYPWTQRSTALNVDFFGARLRACLNGDFYDGGEWLYGGKRVKGDLWGCVGAWYSGAWYDAGSRRYIDQVKAILAAHPWRNWSG
jgi:RTX calcium-binding nonapeptide repeat (4 copies)/Transglycosylase SLT domain